MVTEAIQGTSYRAAAQNALGASDLSGRFCPKDNFINAVVAPNLESSLAPRVSIGGKIINHLTNAYDLVGTLQQELCDNGRISGQSARELAGVAARTATSGAIIYGTGTLAAIGAVTAGPILALGALAAGGVALAFGPPAAERLVNWGLDSVGDLLACTEGWIRR